MSPLKHLNPHRHNVPMKTINAFSHTQRPPRPSITYRHQGAVSLKHLGGKLAPEFVYCTEIEAPKLY